MSALSKRTLFVIQPSNKGADEIYQLIASAASEARLTTVHADSIEFGPGTNTVSDDIEKALFTAAVIVADVTDATPNVMYEIGMARAREKPLILIAKSSRGIPFDLAHFRIVIYEPSSPTEFVSRISAAIKQALRQPEQFHADRASVQRKQYVLSATAITT